MFRRRRIDKDLILKEEYPTPKPSLHLGKILLAVFLVFFAIGITETARANAIEVTTKVPPAGNLVIPHEAGAGQLLFRDQQGQHRQAFHLNSEAEFQITGMVASVALTQAFKNTSSDWQEGIYVFPLPEKAAVSHMEMIIGDRKIIGKVKEKQAAKRIYTKAKAQGKKAALVEQERPNLFTQSVANIGPGETVAVTLHYQQTITYDQGDFSVRFPMTLTPRFIPGNSTINNTGSAALNEEYVISHSMTMSSGWGWSRPTDEVSDAHRITPFMTETTPAASHTMQLNIQLDAGLPLAQIESPYHDIVINKQQQQHHVTTRTKTVSMNRDFELRWRPVAEQAPSAAVFQERLNVSKDEETAPAEEDYALLMLLPPQIENQQQALPRQVTFIIDTSGSMQGTSIVQAKQSLQLALSRLKTQDQFNIIEFNSHYTQLFPQPQMANSANVQQAKAFVKRLNANGGTQMAPALKAALLTPTPEAFLKQVVFITDGSVGNESALFTLIDQHLAQARLFTVGIGSAPNSYFMRKSAEFGRGSFTHIGKVDEVNDKMNNLFRKLESPVLSNLQIQWPDNLKADTWPKQLPDLYLGEPLVLQTRFDTPLKTAATVTVTGQVAGQSWQRKLHLQPLVDKKTQKQQKGIAKLWAREKISALLDEKVRGKDPAEVREAVLNIALQHQLVSPYTSLVAVEEVISRPAEAALAISPVPNQVAKGQVAQPQSLLANKTQQVAYPRTATSAPLNLLLGLLAAIGLMVVRKWGYRNGL